MKTPSIPTLNAAMKSKKLPSAPKAEKPKAKSNPIDRLGAYAHPPKKK